MVTEDSFPLANDLGNHLFRLIVFDVSIEGMVDKENVDLLALLLSEAMNAADGL